MKENIEEKSYNFLNTVPSAQRDGTYEIIAEVLTKMAKSGIFNLAAGYCISMSDMVRTALRARGIESRLVECTLTLTYHNESPPTPVFVGFSEMNIPGEIDTHVILITETEPAYLIDASIPHRLPVNSWAVIQPIVSNRKNLEILNCRFQDVGLIYEEKKIQHVPIQYQESIIERINTDRKIFKNLGLLKMLIAIALTVSTLNAIRGAYDFYSVYILEKNSWGPKTLQGIDQRLYHIEELLHIPVEERRKRQ